MFLKSYPVDSKIQSGLNISALNKCNNDYHFSQHVLDVSGHTNFSGNILLQIGSCAVAEDKIKQLCKRRGEASVSKKK